MNKKECYCGKEIFSGEELKKLLKDCDENVIFCKDTGDFEYFKGYTILSLDMTIRDLIKIHKEKDLFNDMKFLNKEEFIEKQNLNEKEWSKEMSKEFYNSTEVIDLKK